jgi:hypothetical protein
MKRFHPKAISQRMTCLALTVGGLLASSCQGFAFDEAADSATKAKPDVAVSGSADEAAASVHPAIKKATVLIRRADSKAPGFEPGILMNGSEAGRTIVLYPGKIECEVGDAFQVELSTLSMDFDFERRWVNAFCIHGGSQNRLFSLLSISDEEAENRAISLSDELPNVDEELLVYGLSSEGFGKKLKTEIAKVLKLQQITQHFPWNDCICNKLPDSNMTQVICVFDTNGRFVGIQSNHSSYRNPELTHGRLGVSLAVDFIDKLKDNGVAVPETLLAGNLQRRIERAHTFRPISSVNVTISWSDKRDELQGQSGKTGKWSMLKIPKQDFLIPIIGDNAAAVMIGESLAAYSAECGRWDVLEVPGINEKGIAVDNDSVKVFVGEEKRFYVFSSKSGEWTSPTDPDYRPAEEVLQVSTETARRCIDEFKDSKASLQISNGTMTIRGTKRRVDEVARKVREIAAADLQALMASKYGTVKPGGFSLFTSLGNVSQAERQSLELAKVLRNGNTSAQQREELKSLVSGSLDERLNQQRKLAKQLEEKFKAIQAALQSREKNRDRIIDRRVEELLDPNVEWRTLIKLPKPINAMPVSGTPIGLPGPPHLPLGGPATVRPTAKIVSDLIELRKSAESAAGEVRDMQEELQRWLRPLESIRKDYDNDPDIDASHRLRVINGNTQDVKHQQQALRDRVAEWQAEWQSYVSQTKHNGLILDEKRLQLVQLQESLARMTDDPRIASTTEEIKGAELNVNLARIEAERAEEDFNEFNAIEKDSLHLNPATFDLTELLADPQTMVNDTSPAKSAGQVARIPMPDIAKMDSPAEIVHELGSRRRLAELVATTLNGHLEKFGKYSQPLETLLAGGFDGEESHRQNGINIALRSIHHDQKDLPHMMSAWKNAWRAYEAHVTHRRLNLEEKTTTHALAQLKLEQLKGLSEPAGGANEIKQAELQLKLTAIEVNRAKEDLAVFEAIAKGSPHLNPESFDTTKLLETVTK